MTERVKQQYDLSVLKLSLDRSDPLNFPLHQTVFELEVNGQLIGLPRKIDTRDLGLPATLKEMRRYRYQEPDFHLPSTIAHELNAALVSSEPLWLELTDSSSNLVMVPWERLLQPYLNRPLLRLPYFALQPITNPVPTLELVLCASAPEAKSPLPIPELLTLITRTILETVDLYTVIHIFTDDAFYELVQQGLRGLPASPDQGEIHLHNPQTSMSYSRPQRTTQIQEIPGYLESPWLRWISEALAGRSVDLVHFICHGYLSSDQGALAFAETPTYNRDQSWARFIGPQQLSTFLTQIGAWGVVLTSPEANFSILGLRLLADQLAHTRPGLVLLYELNQDDWQATALASTYRFLLDRVNNQPPPISSALSLYCHPADLGLLEKGIAISSFSLPSVTQSFAQPKDISSGQLESVPGWLAASQRFIEQSAAQYLEQSPQSERETAKRQGIEDALTALTDIIERHLAAETYEQEGDE
jgi:hypothetical protein